MTGYVCLCFDDGWSSVLSYAYPVMAAANIPGTVYAISDYVGGAGYMSGANLLTLQTAGWEIGSHTKTHANLTEMSVEDATTEMTASKTALEAIGLTVTTMAYPGGKMNAALRTAAAAIYERQRTSDFYDVFLRHFPASVRTIGGRAPTSLTSAQNYIDEAIATDSVIVLLYHAVDADGTLNGLNHKIQDVVAYIVAKQASSGLQAIRITDLSDIGTTDVCEWVATGDGNLSTDANWDGGVAPTAGKHLIFSARSNYNCTIDSTAAFGDIVTTVDYSGTIAQGSNTISHRDMLIKSGVTTAFSTTLERTCSGSFRHEGTMDNAGVLTMTGTGSLYWTASKTFAALTNSGTVTLRGATALFGATAFSNSGTFIVWGGQDLYIRYYATGTFANTGTINGPGTVTFKLYDGDKSITFGTINAPIRILLHDAAAASRTMSLGANAALGSTLTVQSAHATNTITLDLAGHSLTARGITVGTRGVLLGGEGVIRNYGNLDTSAGTWTPETCQYIQAGAGTIKLGVGQTFNDLIIRSGAAGSSLLSDVTVDGIYAHVPEIIKGEFTLTYDAGKEYTGKRRPLQKRIIKRIVWPSLADKELLEEIERVSA